LATLAEVIERYNWLCHAYCLMTNHYHLLVETVGNLSKGERPTPAPAETTICHPPVASCAIVPQERWRDYQVKGQAPLPEHETRGLIRILMLTSTIVGLYLIWFSALPALHIFDDVVLWYGTVTVDGAAQPLPITLGNLGQALLFAIGTWVLADRLPALFEILLLQRFEMTAASRYTVTT
jgi:hypothetical protein